MSSFITLISQSSSTTTSLNSPMSLFYSNANSNPPLITEIGGKAMNLHRLDQIPNIQVPKWVALQALLFEDFLKNNQILPLISELSVVCNKKNSRESLQLHSKNIQTQIIEGKFTPNQIELILSALNNLNSSHKITHYAVRSSGVLEDSENSSYAGLYDSILNCTNESQIFDAIKRVWASSFNLRVIQERTRLQISQENFRMGIIIQELVPAAVSGVASTIVLSNNYPGIEISANYGFGEGVVGGETSVDNWIIHPTQKYILQATKGSKECYYTLDPEGGIKKELTSQLARGHFSLIPEQLKELSTQVEKIQENYQCNLDIEFAFDQKGILYILQARPLVTTRSEKIQVINPIEAKNYNILSHGLYSVPGVAIGKAVYVDSLSDLSTNKVRLAKGDIVIAHVTTNVWTQYLSDIGGLITRDGSPSSHAILLTREKRIPCLIGIGDEFNLLIKKNQTSITLDGFNKKIYEGEVPLQEATMLDLQKQFEPIPLRTWPDVMSSLPGLLHNNMVIEHENLYWRKTPTYRLQGFQLEINLKRFDEVSKLLNKNIKINSRVIDGYVCNELVPFEKYVSLFDKISLEEASQFNNNHKKCLKKFLDLSKNFKFDPLHWENYVNTYIELRAFIWLGGAFRAFAEREVDLRGIRLNLPLYFLNQCEQFLQDQIPEMDVKMQETLYDVGKELQNNELPEKFEEANTSVQEKVYELSKEFRFEHTISLDIPLDIHTVYNRVKQEVEQIKKGKSFTSEKKLMIDRDFLVNFPEFKEWLRLSIENRILQCDSHHIDAISRAYVQPKLFELGQLFVDQSLLKDAKDIFTLSIEEIKQRLIK